MMKKPISISLILGYDDSGTLALKSNQDCLPNDPLYLMTPSSAPEPFRDRAMFAMYNERTWAATVGDMQGEIRVRCTMALADAINEEKSSILWPKSYPNPGSAPWGKHADRNKGVSIMRARRELELSLAWVNNYEPEERWWSVEVEFDPILDEIFGVVNNKQHAHGFVGGAGANWEEMKDVGETDGTFRERLAETSDPRAYLLEVWIWIDDQIRRMRKERQKIREGTRTPRHPQTDEEIEDVATKVINEQMEQGETGDTDRAPEASAEEKIQQIVESAKQVRVGEETAQEWAEEIIRSGRRVLLKSVTLGHRDAFFDVESVNDVIEVWLNDKHPVHEHLIEVVTAESEDESLEELMKATSKGGLYTSYVIGCLGAERGQGSCSNEGYAGGCKNGLGQRSPQILERD